MILPSTRIIKHSSSTLGEEEIEAVRRVVLSGNMSNGETCNIFEENLSEVFNVKYAKVVNSGTSALELALISLDVYNKEVILPSYACGSLLYSVYNAGAIPIIVDVDKDGNILAQEIEKHITLNTAAIIIIHIFGKVIDKNIFTLGIDVIEDCTMSIGDPLVGYNGTIGVCSFYATKMICTGEGGVVFTKKEELNRRISQMRSPNGLLSDSPRFNYKMSDMQAAIGIEQLKKLNSFISLRRSIATIYDEGLKCFTLPTKRDVYYRYIITTDLAEILRNKMLILGIVCGYGVLEPLSKLTPKAVWLCKHSLSLPIYPNLEIEDARFITKTIRELI